jgi:predicted chitinase
MFYTGVVENRQDPLQLGRCQVRIVGLHTHDKVQLPTQELPWAMPVQPIGSAAMNGIGFTPVGPVEGTTVIIMFADQEQQQPIILGTVGGIPQTPVAITDDDSGAINTNPKTRDIKLRTIPGPVSGNQLTFYDPETGSTNLTSSLKANMKVIGFGLPENTFIVRIDNSTQITINNNVVGYIENIITFGDVPTNLAAVNASKVEGVLTDSFGNPVLDGSGNPVKAGNPVADADTAATPKATSTNVNIPTIPPPKSSSNETKSKQGIKALISACDKVGLTTKEQKCALLGIAGGESTWIPQQESFTYSETRLKQIYSFATPEDITQYSNASRKGITREDFFSWAYGPTKRGKGFLGNQTDADGGKYYGRGFIQLTGRANYQRYQNLANQMGLTLDIVNNPDSLDNDINVSALVAALYIKDRVPKSVSPTAHPGYFLAAKKAVGVNSPDIAARKQSYYEYFYGTPSSSSVEKDAGAPTAQPPENFNGTPGPSANAQKTGSDNTGFRDPNNKYPLPDYINEPDTNRLARGIKDGTVIEKKDGTRAIGIPKALDNGSWDQPVAPFGAKYPFNKVFETESGHIQEFDDTPGQERIHTYHRSGTFQEIDPQGTQVNYIVGDNFVLMERNGCISVRGECNITVDGNTNIYARTDANIQVDQNATIKVGNNADIGIATDLTMAVGGDMKVKVAGDYSIQAANIYSKADGNHNTQAVGALNIKGATSNFESEGDANYLSGGTTNMDYSQGQFGNGASGATDVEDVPLTPPPQGSPVSPVIPFLIPPERAFEEKAAAETPDDFNTPEGRAVSNQETVKEGVPNAPAPVASETAPAATGGTSTTIPVTCDVIYTTKNFTNDFVMSKNFTLGMLMDGGVNGKHRLVDQLLKDSASSPERLYTVGEVVCNLAQTCQNILEPMLGVLPGGIGGYNKLWKISSGYRLKGVVPNESPTSDHCKGMAIDIALIGTDRITKTYELIQKIEKVVPYDQLILEYRFPESVWIHVSYKTKGTRKMAFTMVNDSTYKRDVRGIPAGYFLVDSIPPKNKKIA